MLRPPSTPTRALRAVVALVTVWCLGCSAFEPLLDRLAGASGGAGMVCASDGGMDDAPAAPQVSGATTEGVRAAGLSTPSHASVAPPDAPAGSHAYVCECQFCHAVQLAVAGGAGATPAAPERPQPVEPATPSSVSREPLVPPPQRAL